MSSSFDIPILSLPADTARAEALRRNLQLDAGDLALLRGERGAKAAAVAKTLEDVALRRDAALVDLARQFDDPAFDAKQLRISPQEIAAAHGRVPQPLLAALRHSISQITQYQQHLLPIVRPPLERPGFAATLRWTPLDSVGLYIPGGAASYPSTLIMLAVPAKIAGVGRIAVATPPGQNLSDALLAVAHELQVGEIYRTGGAGAICALALGTETVRAVDKIFGPGNEYVQLAKKAVSGAVGTDGFLGPSEILIIADETADRSLIAADMLAQAEHDPGSCFLLTTSQKVASEVSQRLVQLASSLGRQAALSRSLTQHSAILVCDDSHLIEWANRLAAEHVSLRVASPDELLPQLRHAGCVFIGDASPVAAGDYLAGPSHCLPTNTTARFASGVSVYDFLKRSSVVRYTSGGIAADAPSIIQLAEAEGLPAHALSVRLRSMLSG